MKFGCCLGIDKYKDLVDAGYDFIELAGTSIYKMSEPEFKQVRAILKEGPLQCAGFNAFLSPEVKVIGDCVDDGKVDEYTDKVIYRAGVLGIKNIGFGSPFSRTVLEGFSREQAVEQAIAFVENVSKKVDKYHIQILVEPVCKLETNFINSTAEALRIIHQVNRKNVGLLLDLYHFCVENEDVGIIGSSLMEHLRHVHIAEENGKVYPIRSQYDKYKTLIDRLKLAGYNGTLSIEASYHEFAKDAVCALDILKEIDNEP